jgi:hypothetical protein
MHARAVFLSQQPVMQYEAHRQNVTCHETYHSGSTSVIIDILIISVIDEVATARSLKTHCIFLVSSMSWKMTQPEDGFLVKRVELG